MQRFSLGALLFELFARGNVADDAKTVNLGAADLLAAGIGLHPEGLSVWLEQAIFDLAVLACHQAFEMMLNQLLVFAGHTALAPGCGEIGGLSMFCVHKPGQIGGHVVDDNRLCGGVEGQRVDGIADGGHDTSEPFFALGQLVGAALYAAVQLDVEPFQILLGVAAQLDLLLQFLVGEGQSLCAFFDLIVQIVEQPALGGDQRVERLGDGTDFVVLVDRYLDAQVACFCAADGFEQLAEWLHEADAQEEWDGTDRSADDEKGEFGEWVEDGVGHLAQRQLIVFDQRA